MTFLKPSRRLKLGRCGLRYSLIIIPSVCRLCTPTIKTGEHPVKNHVYKLAESYQIFVKYSISCRNMFLRLRVITNWIENSSRICHILWFNLRSVSAVLSVRMSVCMLFSVGVFFNCLMLKLADVFRKVLSTSDTDSMFVKHLCTL